ncbi:MAG: amino acid permease, partial [Thermodesulfobacteriota bacterium]
MPEPRARNPSRHNDDAAPGRNRFGTFGGVFTPAILTILGVIMFMRANFVVGQAGIMGAVFILVIAKSITLTTSFSISAISTNIRVRGGGSYFLISRVLGLEFGGAIGIALFLALALSVPFYILGFAEALVRSFPGLAPWFLAITLTTALALFTIGYIGAGWAIRTQYMIMAFLFAAIAAFLGGALRDFSAERFLANLGPAYTAVEAGGGEMYAFWSIFAIYFPAVTGIDAGVNMSGDLRDPGRSIPRGTFAAVGVGFTVYLVQILLAGGAWERGQLVGLPFDLLKDKALFGWSILVVLGVVAATLSSALGSYLGAPRVLQAVSRDRILSVLAFFGKGSAGGDEPRRALLFTLAITVAVLLWAGNEAGGEALNAVAAIITMFFLYSYGMINLAAFMEDFSDTPAFRPRFRYFHWGVALAGAAGCAVTAFLVNWRAAAVAILIIAAFLSHIKRTRLKSQFGDARWGFIYQRVKRNLLRLGSMADDPRNWRPTVLVFSGNPADREILVHYSEWIAARRGLVYLACCGGGDWVAGAPRPHGALLQLNRFCADHELQALPAVMVADDVEGGVEALLQAVSIG